MWLLLADHRCLVADDQPAIEVDETLALLLDALADGLDHVALACWYPLQAGVQCLVTGN